MNTESTNVSVCHADHPSGTICHCGCGADEFLAEPTAIYTESRRGFLKRVLIGGAAVATLPLLTDEAEAGQFTPSVSDQRKLGEQAAQQILQKYHEVRDSRATHFNQIGARLVNALSSGDRSNWDFKFHVIESEQLNAFALPGGHMFLFTGLMDKMKSDSEIAAVTGHEMTHVRKQHWAKAYAAQQKRELGIAAVLGLFKAGRTVKAITSIGEQVYTLKFSRGEDDEADAGGLQNMVDAGYDPHGMLDLFHTLETASGKGGVPAFLSDHPLTSERIKRTQQRIDALDKRR
ncbi:MAG: Peptidase family [Chthonomonadales bacterium]|nr:Peptidase family [Chthonomonadales bacterium]